MLRYKVYAVVTHEKFPKYAFVCSILLYFIAIYAIFNPQLLSRSAFISENALGPSYQISAIDNLVTSTSLKDFTQWESSSIYYFYLHSNRTPHKACTAFLFAYGGSKIGIELALSIKKYSEAQPFGGDLLIILYKPSSFSLEFRKFLQDSEGTFGVIRCFFDFDIDQSYSFISVSPDGLNGIQTDLDQLVGVIQLIKKTNLDFRYPVPYKSPFPSLSLSLSSWSSILSGNTHSPHSYLLSTNHVAVKIFSVTSAKPTNINRLSMLRLVEMIYRAFTSLDETLHAGYYFYYYTSPVNIMPLSKYAYVVLALILPLLFQAVLILKEEWWERNAGVMLIAPYLACGAAYLWLGGECGGRFRWEAMTLVALGALPKGAGRIFKAYSNLTLGTSIAIMSIRCFPFALILGLLVPIKLLLSTYKSKSASFIGILLIATAGGLIGLEELWKIESCSGHLLLFNSLCVVLPSLLHILYLFN